MGTTKDGGGNVPVPIKVFQSTSTEGGPTKAGLNEAVTVHDAAPTAKLQVDVPERQQFCPVVPHPLPVAFVALHPIVTD